MTRLRTGNESGFALVLTLVVTALMVAVTAELIHQVYVDTSLSRGFRDGQQASLLAESGISGGIKLLQLSLSGQDYSSLSDKWAAPFKLDDETGSIEITAVEESGKINLNRIVQQSGEYDEFIWNALKQLGKRLQIPEDCWSALADWIDPNDLPRSGGAEMSYYKSLKRPYSARNATLTTVNELSLVKGFTPEIIAKLRPFVTIYADDPNPMSLPRVNINTAPMAVVAALDDSINVERILEARRLKPFKLQGELLQVEPKISSTTSQRISLKGNVFRITSKAQVKDTGRTVEAVVRLTGGTPEFLSWQE